MKPVTCSRRYQNFSRSAARTIFTTTTQSGRGASPQVARLQMRTRELSIAAFAVLMLACTPRAQAKGAYGIGRVATPAEIAGWNIDIDRDGHNLPPGSGSGGHGHEVFDQQCAACHGAKGEGGLGDH